MEFVDHERLEGIGQGIDVVDPAAPSRHVIDGDDETSEDDQGENDGGGGNHGLRERSCGAGNCPEDHGHDQDSEEREQQEKEESARFPTQIRHEVQGQVEDEGVGNLVWQIAQHRGDGFSRWVVKSVGLVFFDNGTLRVESENFESTGEGVHKTSEEEQSATLVEAVRCGLEVVEDTGDDESHDGVSNQSTDAQTRITGQALPTSPEAQLNLLHVGEGEGRLDTLALGLLGLLGRAKSFSIGTVDGMRRLVGFDLGLQSLVLGALLPGGSELIGCAGSLVLPSRTHNTLQGTCHGSQEIGGGLARRAIEAESLEVLTGLAGLSEEDLTSFVKHEGLVEKVVCALGSLVDGNAASALEKVARHFQVLAELDGIGAIETSCAVIPALKRGTGQGSLGNGDTLALTTRHTANVLVTYTGVDCVADAEHGHHNIPQVLGKHVLGDPWGKLAGRAGAGSKSEGVAN